MGRQLNIRSDEAWTTAREIAAHQGKSTTEVVVEALREHRKRSGLMSKKVAPEDVERDMGILAEMIEAGRKQAPPGVTSDHGDLYDLYDHGDHVGLSSDELCVLHSLIPIARHRAATQPWQM